MVTHDFIVSFSTMNDLEGVSTHIHDKISSLQHLLDLSGGTWFWVLQDQVRVSPPGPSSGLWQSWEERG